MPAFFHTLFPFLRWFPMSRGTLRADLLAGITVALVLVPQSMAYAQLAGLPVVYGLYASFVPVIVGSLWGSCSQLHTGPVAMLSLMSAAALIPFASPGSDQFIALSVMLALMVGVLRLFLGAFRLGAIVNLLSTPVIVGFTNAAALIIGLSQFSKVIGVPFPRTDSYLLDLWRVVTQVPQLHWATLAFALGAWLIIAGLRRVAALPGVAESVAAERPRLAQAAFHVQISMAGMLTFAFFLSRSYNVRIYMMCALAVALVQIARRTESGWEGPTVPVRPEAWLALSAGSVVFLYLVTWLLLRMQ